MSRKFITNLLLSSLALFASAYTWHQDKAFDLTFNIKGYKDVDISRISKIYLQLLKEDYNKTSTINTELDSINRTLKYIKNVDSVLKETGKITINKNDIKKFERLYNQNTLDEIKKLIPELDDKIRKPKTDSLSEFGLKYEKYSFIKKNIEYHRSQSKKFMFFFLVSFSFVIFIQTVPINNFYSKDSFKLGQNVTWKDKIKMYFRNN